MFDAPTAAIGRSGIGDPFAMTVPDTRRMRAPPLASDIYTNSYKIIYN
jgi:hypothetical protein